MKRKAVWFLIGTMVMMGISNSSYVWAEEAEQKNTKKTATIGISIPDIQNTDSATVAQYLSQKLEEMDYDVELRFAWGEDQRQKQDLEKWIEEDIDLLVLELEDSEEFIETLDEAKEKKIPVISLENLLNGTDATTCFLTYDYKDAGEQIGNYIKEKENLDKVEVTEPKTIEFLFDETTSEEKYLYYLGLMEVLRPYLENGSLKCNSNTTEYLDICEADKKAEEEGKKRIETVLEEYYEKESPDIICAVSDSKAEEAILALASGKTGEERKKVIRNNTLEKPKEQEEKEETYPLITGGNASVSGMNHILKGEQTVTFYKDPQKIALLCADTIDKLINDKEKVEYVYQYDNGMVAVPSVLQKVELVDQENYQALLIDTGVYTIEQQIEE